MAKTKYTFPVPTCPGCQYHQLVGCARYCNGFPKKRKSKRFRKSDLQAVVYLNDLSILQLHPSIGKSLLHRFPLHGVIKLLGSQAKGSLTAQPVAGF